ncbi:MAG: 4-hydroxythreonine-4-phosphate dehydrogenase PdxA [Candidatus Saganbacteria bacterium]|nr:4-hydroxythreonine-4-phosphate dehydrogenase PdxA [Candidatus Saganbacteria bacterium]
MEKPIIGITMGDASGIGPEIAAKAASSGDVHRICKPLVIGDSRIMLEALKIAKLQGVGINPIKKVKDARFTKWTIDILDLENLDPSKVKIGQICAPCGKAAIQYLETAIKLAMAKEIDGIATAPINKEAIHKAGYRFAGHTEILAKRTKCKNYAMMFVSEPLWVILVTTHMPIKDISKHINKKKVLQTIKLANQVVKKLRGKKPKIGVAGLNPHAGESGIFGKEEIKHIKPAVDEAKKQGIDVVGPISPDAIFYLANAGMFDIVVAMYHDQGLIPLKLLAFNRSVNVTVGLPIVRTSVDHGTGFDIAGKGWANPQSLIEAINVATFFAHGK